MPAFSIVIPCYNAETTLTETLRSVVRQTFQDFEVIVLDDGSSDQTSKIAHKFAEVDSRFRLIQLENGGPSRARNIGAMYFSKGQFVAFLDGDDQWSKDKLATCLARLSAPNAPDGVYSQIAFFCDKPSDARTRSTVIQGQLAVEDLLKENTVCTMSNVVICRQAMHRSGGFDPDIVHGEDLEWLVRLVSGGSRVEAIDECLTYYRTNSEGLSADLNAMRTGWQSALESALACGVNLTTTERLTAEAVHLRYLARRALRVRVKRGTALRFAIAALNKSPSAFFAQPKRGLFTLAGAMVEPFMPSALRHAAFAN